MLSPAEQLFRTLDSYSEIERLITEGETENLYLECKSPRSPQLDRGLKSQLAEAISGFANTEGGVILWGVSTTKHEHGNLDVLSQTEPIGKCQDFARQIDKNIPLLTTPSIHTERSTVLHSRKGDTKGIVVTFIPQSLGDPIQINDTKKFHFRNVDEFSELPYEILKRMFLGTRGPNLSPIIAAKLVTRGDNGDWSLPIVLRNESSAVAEHVVVVVRFLNPEVCNKIESQEFQNVSHLNIGERVFQKGNISVIHRGLNILAGHFQVAMKKQRRAYRVLNAEIEIYASQMRAKRTRLKIQLAKSKFDVKILSEQFIY